MEQTGNGVAQPQAAAPNQFPNQTDIATEGKPAIVTTPVVVNNPIAAPAPAPATTSLPQRIVQPVETSTAAAAPEHATTTAVAVPPGNVSTTAAVVPHADVSATVSAAAPGNGSSATAAVTASQNGGTAEETSAPESALHMFASNEDAGNQSIDLDDLFSECYFGDFPVPPFSQPNHVYNSAASNQTPSAPMLDSQVVKVNNPMESLPQKRKLDNTNEMETSTTMPVPVTSDSAVTVTAANVPPVTMQSSSAAAAPAASAPALKTTPMQLPTSILSALSSGASNAMTMNSTVNKKLTDQQKLERRERNREHAKRSRLRKKFLLESLQGQIHGLQSEIDTLKNIIKRELPDKAELLLATLDSNQGRFTPLPMPSGFGPVKTLMEPDFRLMSSLSNSQQNFAISDPSLPDNPIVYASQGFFDLTGYTLDQVLGRNCRFLQGPGTDQSAVDVIRKGVREGIDTSVCLLNYKADGTPFWNQFFVAALRDAQNNVVNYVGVQCEVSKAVVESQINGSGTS
eukprot:CAMPEP_0172517764 /NCGR_PEP_ID=MMETSP1066-20121228/287812_1 /TAXON_ID=671091 /ORGANISM="Coscinodiscus wailesii, Strain CCMP2513" /LENGTH=514 /DNA_ID=CAMNT_0013299927 /DNA_START=17 /DNA_END=1561 /DNA_ORIENTATION=-